MSVAFISASTIQKTGVFRRNVFCCGTIARYARGIRCFSWLLLNSSEIHVISTCGRLLAIVSSIKEDGVAMTLSQECEFSTIKDREADQYLRSLPRSVLEGLRLQAESDAELVAVALGRVHESTHPKLLDLTTLDLPCDCLTAVALLNLGAALRILYWESLGLVTADMKLPPGKEAVQHALLSNLPATNNNDQLYLTRKVYEVCLGRFLLPIDGETGATVRIDGDIDDERVIEAFAAWCLQLVRILQTELSRGET